MAVLERYDGTFTRLYYEVAHSIDHLSLSTETAALRVPYKGTSNKGILMNSDEGLVMKISDANRAGYRVEIHAIGTLCHGMMTE